MISKPTFSDLGIGENLCSALFQNNIETPTEIQQQVIPLLQSCRHVLFQSETGTGKTFAYLLPFLEKITPQIVQPQLLIAAPTHELASQIKKQIQSVSSMKTALLIGGSSLKRQTEQLKEKPYIITGTPARLLELIHLKKLKTNGIHSIVLDEVDRLFDPELRDITKMLLRNLPETAQIAACSATVPINLEKKLSAVLQEQQTIPVQEERNLVTVRLESEDILRKNITHIAIFSTFRNKSETLRKLLVAEQPKKAIVFTSRPDQVDIETSKLIHKNIPCAALHSKADKLQRKYAIDAFRSGKCTVLVTSDLAARGLDIPGVTHIIQLDMPSSDNFFIHRAGRTGRAGQTGKNIIIGDEWELRKLAALEKKLKLTVYPKVLFKGKLLSPDYPDEDAKQSNHPGSPV